MNLKRIVKYIICVSPKFLRAIINKKIEQREIKEARKRIARTKVSKSEVLDLINKLDVDCDVMLHSSMMNIGKMQIGIKGICEALFERINLDKNTLLVSALPFRGRFLDYLNDGPIFDVRNAPIAMGAINERIAMMPNVCRSIHPTHSVVAIGRSREYYTNTHHVDATPFGLNSPYYKLIKNRGKVILFGATLNNLTCIHAIEDMLGDAFPVKIYYKKRFNVKCIDNNGCEIMVKTPCHNPVVGVRRDLLPLKEHALNAGAMRVFPMGESEFAIIDMYKFTLFYLAYIKNGNSIYGKIKVTDKLKSRIKELETELKK